mmetsp:Transcript_32437/g.74527  ORF Transcript_32437/g.74527 Transcript_32437/m.74527 type:complete len:185 (+) Transcript_32437:75-629(+)
MTNNKVLSRLLQETQNTTAPGSIRAEFHDAYDLVAILSVYLLLALCCAISIGIVSRRRRLEERLATSQSYLQRRMASAANGELSFAGDPEEPSGGSQPERLVKLQDALRRTTMVSLDWAMRCCHTRAILCTALLMCVCVGGGDGGGGCCGAADILCVFLCVMCVFMVCLRFLLADGHFRGSYQV